MACRIDDGHPTFIEFRGPNNVSKIGDPNPTNTQDGVEYGVAGVLIWEKTVTPPGMQGGGANDTTTMRNDRWRTMAPKHLMTLSEMSVTFAYSPSVYENLLGMMQINQVVAVIWPDESELVFWGFLDEFTPNEISEGEQPDADATIIPTNQNNDCEEVPPDYIPGTGT